MDTEIRELFARRAEDANLPRSLSPALRRRIRRGRATVAALAALVAVALVAVSLSVVGSLSERTTSRPGREGGVEPTVTAEPIVHATVPGRFEPLELDVRYETSLFKPRISFTTGDVLGWQVDFETARALVLIHREGRITFGRPAEVYEPNENNFVDPVPPNVLEWLQAHPLLDVSTPTNVSVGGLRGSEVLVTVRSLPEEQHVRCPAGPCVALFPTETREPIWVSELSAWRVLVLDSDGDPLVVVVPEQGPGNALLETLELEGR